MTVSTILAIALLAGVAALLYSSVGQGGASGYLAVMALFGVSAAVMRPAALTLNVLVALIAAVKFYRAGCFSWRIFWPFALTSVPAAYAGGRLELPAESYRAVVGVVLVYAAVRMLRAAREPAADALRPPPVPAALVIGAGIGLLSGLTGVGGGIFLSPIVLTRRWSDIRTASGVAALFILVNSAAGLLGYAASGYELPAALPVWGVAVGIGGWIGAEYGTRRLGVPALRAILAALLLLAGAKMMLG